MNTKRREFLKTLGLTGIGLSIGLEGFSKNIALKKINKATLALEINPFIIIENTGKITLVNSRPDMGQGSTQAVPSLLAEELEEEKHKTLGVTIIDPLQGRVDVLGPGQRHLGQAIGQFIINRLNHPCRMGQIALFNLTLQHARDKEGVCHTQLVDLKRGFVGDWLFICLSIAIDRL